MTIQEVIYNELIGVAIAFGVTGVAFILIVLYLVIKNIGGKNE